MVDGGEGVDKDGGNGVGAVYAVQVSHVGSFVIWERELSGDRGYDKSTRGVLSSGIKKDDVDDGAAYDGRRVGVAPGD